jgi:Uncharacterized protein conserved in bacteria
MLRGAHAIALDTKGRLAVPTKFRDWLREECEGQLVCTIDIANPCLLLYPLCEWEEIEKKLKSLSSMNPVERRLQRLLLGYACECELDGNGVCCCRHRYVSTQGWINRSCWLVN